MRKRRSKPGSLSIKPLYSIAELAEATEVSDFTMRRMLKNNGVELQRSGTATFVPLSELKNKMRLFWESIALSERLSEAAHDD